MEKTREMILSEIRQLTSEIRQRLDLIDALVEQIPHQVRDDSMASQADPMASHAEPMASHAELGSASAAPQQESVEEYMQQEKVFTSFGMSFEPKKEETGKEEVAALIDRMLETRAWEKDMPGSEVEDIRNAISLNDRLLFIAYLFNEDAELFNNTVETLNGCASLDEGLRFLMENFSDWDYDSDNVYRFMMAVRRKLK